MGAASWSPFTAGIRGLLRQEALELARMQLPSKIHAAGQIFSVADWPTAVEEVETSDSFGEQVPKRAGARSREVLCAIVLGAS